MNIDQLTATLKHDPAFMENVTVWETIPPREGQTVDFPASLDARLQAVLKKRGIGKLYTHQASAWEAAQAGKDYVVVTPTASGKTLCYNLPVLSAILKDDDSRALYLFPTKALALDQAGSLYELIEAMDVDVKAYTY
ncbi:MAG: DEAD/DEAH box helicase, partial [Firmicutes bacterium]|nr:DEAD/DEAH box helicase [Bacillota bacterium]